MTGKLFQAMLPTLRSLLTTAGGLAYGTGASTAPAQLAPGTSTQLLHGGATPSWSQVVNADVASGAAIATSKLAAGTERYGIYTVSGVPTWSMPSICRLSHSTTQSIGNGAVTTLTFDTESNDPTGMHAGGAPTRITTLVAGVYLFTGNVRWPTATGTRQLKIQRNSAQDLVYNWVSATGGGQPTIQEVTTFYVMAANDWVELLVFQDSGASLNLAGNGTSEPIFEAVWLGPTS